MSHPLDKIHPRFGTNSIKWEFIWQDEELVYGDHAHPQHGDDQLLPMWVADMDFRCPDAVVDALQKRVAHGIFGYAAPTDDYYSAVIDWSKRRYNFDVKKEWINLAPGIVPAINIILQALLQPEDKVLIQRPVYYPFTTAVENNGFQVVSNSLIYENGTYRMDFEDLEEKTADPDLKIAILCSPHNPVARVWTREELEKFGRICQKNNVVVIADEIHCDLIFTDHEFVAFAGISESFLENTIICHSASKTFNMAGLKISNVIIPNPNMREKFEQAVERIGLYGTNSFGMLATIAAYEKGEQWLDQVMAYIEDNYKFMKAYLAEHLPEIKLVEPEGTYLIWADCSALGLDSVERQNLLREKAKIFFNEGRKFGDEGDAFERINIACPRPILEKALKRMTELFSVKNLA